MSNDNDHWDTLTVPVNGVDRTIKKVPHAECEICAKCKEQLGADMHRGRKLMKRKMAGVDAQGKPKTSIIKTHMPLYYCSPGCLEAHGAVEDVSGGFSF